MFYFCRWSRTSGRHTSEHGKVNVMAKRGRRERGAAAVEMALVMPILILLIGGIIDFGRAFMTQVIVTNAAREGTRVAVVTKDYSQVGNITIRAQAAADLDPLTSAVVQVKNNLNDDKACTTTATTVTVTVSAPFKWYFLGFLPFSLPPTITGKSVQGC